MIHQEGDISHLKDQQQVFAPVDEMMAHFMIVRDCQVVAEGIGNQRRHRDSSSRFIFLNLNDLRNPWIEWKSYHRKRNQVAEDLNQARWGDPFPRKSCCSMKKESPSELLGLRPARLRMNNAKGEIKHTARTSFKDIEIYRVVLRIYWRIQL